MLVLQNFCLAGKFRTKLPDFCLAFTACDEDVRDRDCLYKEKGKQYYDKRCHVKDDQAKVGAIVVLQQKRENKMSPKFSDVPHIILEKKGNSVQLEDNDGIQKRRNVIHMKSVNFEIGANKQRFWNEYRNRETEFDVSEPVGESIIQNESIPGNGNINDQSSICNNEGVGRPKRMVKPPAYLKDYVTCKVEI